jgi:hypothetical protein
MIARSGFATEKHLYGDHQETEEALVCILSSLAQKQAGSGPSLNR